MSLAVSGSPLLGDVRFSLDVALFECTEELEWLEGLLGMAPDDETGVLLEKFEEEQFVDAPESLRMGFVRLTLETGGLSLSVVTGADEESGFFSLTQPVLVELPSNTINGLFLLLSVLELCVLLELRRGLLFSILFPQRLRGSSLCGRGITCCRYRPVSRSRSSGSDTAIFLSCNMS